MINRKLLHDLYAHFSKQEITMIVGLRQAGKTKAMKYLMGELKNSGQKTLFLNLDFDEEGQFFELNTLSFEEYVNYKTGYRYEEKLNHFFELEPEKTRKYFVKKGI